MTHEIVDTYRRIWLGAVPKLAFGAFLMAPLLLPEPDSQAATELTESSVETVALVSDLLPFMLLVVMIAMLAQMLMIR